MKQSIETVFPITITIPNHLPCVSKALICWLKVFKYEIWFLASWSLLLIYFQIRWLVPRMPGWERPWPSAWALRKHCPSQVSVLYLGSSSLTFGVITFPLCFLCKILHFVYPSAHSQSIRICYLMCVIIGSESEFSNLRIVQNTRPTCLLWMEFSPCLQFSLYWKLWRWRVWRLPHLENLNKNFKTQIGSDTIYLCCT